MSIGHLRNALRRDAEALVASIAQPRYATVASVDPATHSVRVMIQPDGVLSGWIPDGQAFASGGQGAIIVAPPAVGDQVAVDFPHGDADHPRITGRLFSSVDAPPVSPVTGKPVQPGEVGIFQPGSAFIHGTGGRWFIGGDLVVTGTITSTGDVSDAHGSLDRLRGAYDGHDHRQPVGPTTRPDSE